MSVMLYGTGLLAMLLRMSEGPGTLELDADSAAVVLLVELHQKHGSDSGLEGSLIFMHCQEHSIAAKDKFKCTSCNTTSSRPISHLLI